MAISHTRLPPCTMDCLTVSVRGEWRKSRQQSKMRTKEERETEQAWRKQKEEKQEDDDDGALLLLLLLPFAVQVAARERSIARRKSRKSNPYKEKQRRNRVEDKIEREWSSRVITKKEGWMKGWMARPTLCCQQPERSGDQSDQALKKRKRRRKGSINQPITQRNKADEGHVGAGSFVSLSLRECIDTLLRLG